MKYKFYTFQVGSCVGKQNNHKNQSIGSKENNPDLSFKGEHFMRSEALFRTPWLELVVISVTSCLAMVSNKSARSDL